MKSTFEEKRSSRIIRYKELASKMESQSEALRKRAHAMADVMQGEPIKFDHHSRKRHRRHIERMHRLNDKVIDLSDRAKHFERRAESIEKNKAISSDDPEAKSKLARKLNDLERDRQRFKEVNKIARSRLEPSYIISKVIEKGFTMKEATAIFQNRGLESYVMKNLAANISATKARLEALEINEKLGDIQEKIGRHLLEVSQLANRVMLFFDTIPEETARRDLKRSGFHWSPVNRCWMRKTSNEAIRQGRRILASY